jgi:N-acyl-D-aspartate/D-glutamate deacylase
MINIIHNMYKKISMYRKYYKTIARLTIIVLCIASFWSCKTENQRENYDFIITSGRVLDGTGNPWRIADIAIKGDKIVKISRDIAGVAEDTINAHGLYVTPGFIDEHSHAATGLYKSKLSNAKPLLLEGITTIVANPDGSGAVDLKRQRHKLLKDGIGVNVAQVVPFGSIRKKVMGMEDRKPSTKELEKMKKLVANGMEEGAFGLSTGVFYAPQSYASKEEIVTLAKVAARYGGIYQSHIRDESNYTVGVRAAVNEVILIVREAKLPGIVDHIKALGPPVWGLSEEIVEDIDQARASGVEIFASQYPYKASATGLIAALVPRWAEEGGYSKLVQRLKDQELIPKIRTEMKENLARRGGADRIQFRRYHPDSTIEGKTLKEVAQQQNISPVKMAIKLIKKGRPSIVSFNMSEEDVNRFMRQRWTMTCSDGGLVPFDSGVPHPRNYGTFPRKIRKYVLEKHVLDLPSAIRSMTSLPAGVYDMVDRGLLREGATADITIFDKEHIRDKATFQDPHQYSKGIKYVLVNGKLAVSNGKLTGIKGGKVLRHSFREQQP